MRKKFNKIKCLWQWSVRLLCVLCVLGAASLPSHAAYPDKPLRIVAPNPPGSVTDLIARPLAQRLTEAWGVPVVVDNRPGAGGNLAGDIVAKAPPDGLSLLMGTVGILTVNPFLYIKMPFDAQRAFASVMLSALVTTVALNADSPRFVTVKPKLVVPEFPSVIVGLLMLSVLPETPPSSSRMVTWPCPSPKVAFVGFDKRTKKFSLVSAVESPEITTEIVALVCPAGIVTEPLTGV